MLHKTLLENHGLLLFGESLYTRDLNIICICDDRTPDTILSLSNPTLGVYVFLPHKSSNKV